MENETEMSEEEAQRRIANAFEALDQVYQLHAPDQSKEEWWCNHCDVEWPCETEKIILESLELT